MPKKESTWTVTQERAEALRPLLKWLSEEYDGTGGKRVKEDARGLIRKIRFEGPSKQVVITAREKGTLYQLLEAFPKESQPARQLKLFDTSVSLPGALGRTENVSSGKKSKYRYKADSELTPAERAERAKYKTANVYVAPTADDANPRYLNINKGPKPER